MSEMKQWVRDCMKPIGACMSAIHKANQYDSPQSAWDNWDNGYELLWTIIRMKYDRSTLIRCICEIAEHTLEIYEKENPGDDRPRKAIEAARIVAEYDTTENRAAADSAFAAYAAAYAAANSAYAAAYAAADSAFAAAYSAADSAYAAAYAAYAAADSADLAAYAAARDVARAAAYAARAAARDADAAYAAAYSAADSAYAAAYAAYAAYAERAWQADCVRRYFPISPFLMEVPE